MEFLQKHRWLVVTISVLSFLAIVLTSVLSMFAY